ncbi:MAG: ABC transporter substrate-binding protein [Acidimicrobiales bacterium]|nr:ABC transporter substrate-binding protein [Acidimicrobiales bacterium]
MAGSVAMVVVAAACGGDDGGGATATADSAVEAVKNEIGTIQLGGTTTPTSAATGTSAGQTASTEPADKPTSMDEWEKVWAAERAAIVKRIKDNKWGLQADGKTVLGAEGFKIDLSACAAGWSNTEGLSDTTIEIGSHTPFSGTLADAGNINKGAATILDHYSKEGFFKDSNGVTRNAVLVSKDDGYDPARTIPLVDEFLDSDKVFAIWGLGSPSVMKTYDKINQRCVPHPFAVTGHPAWGDPVNHPWTTGILFAYNTEAVLWGSFIEQRFEELKGDDGKVTFAALVMNNDFGKSYDGGFRSWLATSPMKDKINYVTETIEPQAPTVKDPMTSLAAENPSIFVAMVAGTPCSQAITEAAENGMRETAKYLFMPSVCKPSSQVGRAVVGDLSDGWWIMGGGGRDINSPAEDANPFIVWARDLLASVGYNAKDSGNFGSGISIGWDWVQTIKIAGELDGGLTRANLMVAARSMEMTHPMYLDGIKFNLNGNADAYWIEGSDLSKYDAAQQSWIPQGDIIELSGKSKNCAWDQAAATCR